MGAKLHRWLAKPSTICFLRRVLAATDIETAAIPLPSSHSIRRQHSYTPFTDQWHLKQEERGSYQRSEQPDGAGTSDQIKSEVVRRVYANTQEPEHSQLHSNESSEDAFKALWHQTDAISRQRRAGLAVDYSRDRNGLKHWTRLLQERHRLNGLPGVLETWKGMKFRGVELPVEGPEADVLWPTLIRAGLATYEPHPDAQDGLLIELLEHAGCLRKQHGAVYSGLYECIIGHFAEHRLWKVPTWHRRLVEDFGFSDDRLRVVAPIFAQFKPPEEARRFLNRVYKTARERNLYDHFMPEILKQGNEVQALKWHRYFLTHRDAPGPEVFQRPEIQRLFEQDGNKSLPMIHTKGDSSKSKSVKADPAQMPPMTRSTMSALVGEAHGIKSKDVSDSFIAKLFATRSFPLDMVTKGLGFFAVEQLGPLSVHEMAMRCSDHHAFWEQRGTLSRMGICIESSVYGRLLSKIVREGSADLFKAVLASDQHPEAYGDSEVQESLLQHFLEQGNLSSAHVTLIVLSLMGRKQHGRAWNVVLQYHIRQGNWSSVTSTMAHIKTMQLHLETRTLNHVAQYVLTPRQRARAPVLDPSTEDAAMRMQFVTNTYMYAAGHGLHVQPHLWKELLKRHGMLCNWDELERLVRWLFSFYSTRFRPGPRTRLRCNRLHAYPGMLEIIFDYQMQKAVVAWAFKDAALRDRLRHDRKKENDRCEPWARGLLLLKEVKKPPEFTINAVRVREAILQRLWVLFGPAWSSRPINEKTQRNNQLTLGHYIRHANEIWAMPNFSLLYLGPNIQSASNEQKPPMLLHMRPA